MGQKAGKPKFVEDSESSSPVPTVHPALHLDTLSELPLTIREVALAAASGSHPDMMKIVSAIREDPPAAITFLPVVYAILDPARVPEKHWHDASSNNDAVALGMAFSIINIIPTFPQLPVAVLEALWPRVWLWVQLIEEYHLLIQNWAGRTDFVMLRLFVSLWPFLEVEPLKPGVHSTPGTHAFVSRSWPHLPLSELEQTNAMTTFFQFIGNCGSACGVHGAKEFIEGLGEDPSVLAALIARHITAVAAACRNPKSTVPRALLLGRLHKLSVHIRMLDTLPYLSAGIVKAQTTAMGKLSPFPDAEDTLNGSFLQLSAFLVYSTGYGHLPEALRAGILNSIVSYGADYQRTDGSAFIFGHFLTAVLPASLAYYRVVSAMVSAFAKISAKPYKPGFVASAIYPAWKNFVAIVQARLRVLEYFLSEDYVRTRACDNLECGVIGASAEFQRCGGCHEHFYCSRECQIVDWNRGGHREACKIHDPPVEVELTKRGDTFLRLILHRDYQAHKFDTLMQQLTYLSSNAGRRDFCTTFNYSSGHCVISVGPVDSSGSGFTERHIAAASSANSCLALHRVILKRGNLDVVRPYVLRSSSPALAMGLEEIRTFVEKTEDTGEVRRMLHVLCEAEVLETHG
ncbi:hypothetical protein DFH06DRAFT_1206197 [Mycena polygramma]|nr:hypothetical protein DFH06DRAFT_1206197 [Mycena polygramma]